MGAKLRTMRIDDEQWRYRIGRSFVTVTSPTGQTSCIDHSKLTGRSWDVLERGRWKRTYDCVIAPRDVRRFIDGLRQAGECSRTQKPAESAPIRPRREVAR